MTFNGISRVFSTENDDQYNTIGAFWDEMAYKYGRSNLGDSDIIGHLLRLNM